MQETKHPPPRVLAGGFKPIIRMLHASSLADGSLAAGCEPGSARPQTNHALRVCLFPCQRSPRQTLGEPRWFWQVLGWFTKLRRPQFLWRIWKPSPHVFSPHSWRQKTTPQCCVARRTQWLPLLQFVFLAGGAECLAFFF